MFLICCFRRNFTTELSNQKLVRLVFNGHVLQPDTKTLQACGLFDNCVVHCLVHNQRPNLSANTQSTNENIRNGDGGNDSEINSLFEKKIILILIFVYFS